nr:hypothetical protein GCM10020093_106000 [Planobispora longispora]
MIATLLFIDWFGDQGWAYTAAAAVMVVVSYVIVGVSPRTLGRQHAEPIALASAPVVYGLTRIFGPLPKLLILIGNAVTPGRGSGRGPSPPRRSCATWSTWRRSAGSSSPTSGR